MKDIYILRGPNPWSKKHTNLIVTDIEIPGKEISARIPSMIKQIRLALPGLSFRNEDKAGLAELILETAVELQNAAEMRCRFGDVMHLDDSLARIAFSYQIEQAGEYAAEAAQHIIEDLIEGKDADIAYEIEELKYFKTRYSLGATSAFILQEAQDRGIPFKRFNRSSLVILGYGNKHKKIRTAVTDTTSGLGIEMAGDKEETKQILAEYHLPVPRGLLVDSVEELKEGVSRLRYPLVTKPLDGNQGRGVTIKINNIEQALFGFEIAQRISRTVILEEYIEGEDYRFLVIDYKLVAVAKRTPPVIRGDGRSTIQELIDEENRNPERWQGTDHVLAEIKIDATTKKILSENNLELSTVLPKDELLYLKKIANISAGGTAIDVTDIVHPANIFLAERVARLFNLNICGIDILTTDVSVPLTRGTGAIVEVNAGPGIRMHTNPQQGIARNVAAPIMDMLFPSSDFRIPVVAVAQSSLSSEITRLITKLAIHSGIKAGYASKDGVYIQDHFVTDENSSDFRGALSVLFDPTVDMAAIECSSESIINEGLAFQNCDMSVITEIRRKDYYGFRDEDAKRTILENTNPQGYAILNADDEDVLALHKDATCQIAMYSIKDSQKLREYCQKGCYGACIEKGYIVVNKGEWKTRIEKLSRLPFNVENSLDTLMPAVLAAFIQGIDPKKIQEALHKFEEIRQEEHA